MSATINSALVLDCLDFLVNFGLVYIADWEVSGLACCLLLGLWVVCLFLVCFDWIGGLVVLWIWYPLRFGGLFAIVLVDVCGLLFCLFCVELDACYLYYLVLVCWLWRFVISCFDDLLRLVCYLLVALVGGLLVGLRVAFWCLLFAFDLFWFCVNCLLEFFTCYGCFIWVWFPTLAFALKLWFVCGLLIWGWFMLACFCGERWMVLC